MTHSKIWLSPLVDGHQPTAHLTKLDKKKPCIVSYQTKQGGFFFVKKNVKLQIFMSHHEFFKKIQN
jgi:hypothetical protein